MDANAKQKHGENREPEQEHDGDEYRDAQLILEERDDAQRRHRILGVSNHLQERDEQIARDPTDPETGGDRSTLR